MKEERERIQKFLERRLPDILLDGFFLGSELIPQREPRFGAESGITAKISSDAPFPGEFFFCAKNTVAREMSMALLGSEDPYEVDDIMAELANVVAGRIALDLQFDSDREPKIGLPKVGQDLFPPPKSLDIHLRFSVEDSHLAVGWKAARS